MFTVALIALLTVSFVACGNTNDKNGDNGNGNGNVASYTVTFDSQGGSSVKSIVVKEGEVLTLPSNPEKVGYVFKGWYLSNEFIEEFNATKTVSSDFTLYAKWEKEGSKGLTFEYVEKDGYYTVTGIGTCTDKNIIIPSEYEGKPVKNIGFSAFAQRKNIESVEIPDSITTITSDAFKYCNGLTSITIPRNVKTIGSNAFGNCTNLTTVNWDATACTFAGTNSTNPAQYSLIFYNCDKISAINIGENVTSIPACAFAGCSGVMKVTIPQNVSSIANKAFYGCYKLFEVYNKSSVIIVAGDKNGNGNVSEYAKNVYSDTYGESKLIIDDNGYVVYPDGNEKILLGYLGTETELTLPSDITQINEGAFYERTELTKVIIPESVTVIGAGAFNCCRNIISITIPSKVTSIENYAFGACHRLIEVYNKSSLIITAGSSTNGGVAENAKNVYTDTEGEQKLSTDDNGFIVYTDGEEKILVGYTGTESELTLPSNITRIHQMAFCENKNLTSVVIPDSVTVIDYWAFIACSNLTSVKIGDGVTTIGESAFEDCVSLTDIIVGKNVAKIEQWAFDNTAWYDNQPDGIIYVGNSIYEYNGTMPENSTIVLRTGTLGICYRAFMGYSEMIKIVIPETVTYIGEGAFRNCTGLEEIRFEGTVEQWNAISKEEKWFSGLNCDKVICNDGEVSLA